MGRRVYATAAAKLGIGCGDVPVAPLASRLAAMPRGLRHSNSIWFGVAWRDARRCGRSRVGWVGGSAIGLEDPAQVGDLRGFVGAFGSVGPGGPRRGGSHQEFVCGAAECGLRASHDVLRRTLR